jgi:hypothetical protein
VSATQSLCVQWSEWLAMPFANANKVGMRKFGLRWEAWFTCRALHSSLHHVSVCVQELTTPVFCFLPHLYMLQCWRSDRCLPQHGPPSSFHVIPRHQHAAARRCSSTVCTLRRRRHDPPAARLARARPPPLATAAVPATVHHRCRRCCHT